MMTTLRTFLVAAVAAFSAGAAHAAAFEAKTMRESLSAREVERSLLIGKGWLEFGLGNDLKIAHGAWSPTGEATTWRLPGAPQSDQVTWTHTTQRLDLRYGIARRGELYWTIKTHYLRLQNDTLGTDLSQFGLGDPRFGYKFELFRSQAPLTSVIAFAEYKAPAGNEAPGNYVGGPTTFSSFIMTTGTPDAEAGLRFKRQVGPLAVLGGASYTRRFSSIVQYVIETDLNQFGGRIKPGDLTKADLGLMVQLGPVAVDGAALFQSRQHTRIGNTAPGLVASRNMTEVLDSDGWALDARTGLTIHITRGVDLVGSALLPIRGEDLGFFPIEDIHPTRGNTYSGTLEFRY